MINGLLSSSRRIEKMVGRNAEMGRLQACLKDEAQKGTQIVFLMGPGGIGKSRFAEEIQYWAGNKTLLKKRAGEHWDRVKPELQGKIIAPDLIDMADLTYHSHLRLMNAIYENLLRQADAEDPIAFTNFEIAYREVLDAQQRESDFQTSQKLKQDAEQKFFEVYEQLARKRKIFLVFDTVEKLGYAQFDWLIEDWKVITEEEMQFFTPHWLVTQVKNGTLPNTVLLLIGRYDYFGTPFFSHIRDVVKEKNRKSASHPVNLTEFTLANFTLAETREFFRDLLGIYQEQEKEESGAWLARERFEHLLQDENRLRTLQAYTAGLPVKLSLYGAILAEDYRIPERLKDDPQKAEAAQGHALENIQREIERDFFSILMENNTLRADIFIALLATPRGLDKNQLYACLYGFESYLKAPAEKLAEVDAELKALEQFSIVKIRPDKRIALQDEIYLIYYRQFFDDRSVTSDAASHTFDMRAVADETVTRKKIYTTLYRYARDRQLEQEKQLRGLQKEDERQLQKQLQTSINNRPSFQPLNEVDRDDRLGIGEAIGNWNMEALHYSLLLDFASAVNNAVFELTMRRDLAANDEADARTMFEVYLVLNDVSLMRFIQLPELVEDPQAYYKRLMRQSEVNRWIERFTLRRQYDRAEKFFEDINRQIEKMPEGKEKSSWTHTFSQGERDIWWAYLQALQSRWQIAIDKLKEVIPLLKKLVNTDKKEVAWTREDGVEERGFKDYVANVRLIRVIALAYNYLGYAQINFGKQVDAVKNYNHTLEWLRKVEARMQMATTLNNLARALSDMGRGRARRVCMDGLELNREKAAEVPIAYSYNTLALIDNDHGRPEQAWLEAATACAYFERSADQRGLGLAYLQLGEALRRMARIEDRTGRVLPEEPDVIFNQAEQVLGLALKIFSKGPNSSEKLRRVEAFIELGCLHRDRIERGTDHDADWMPSEKSTLRYHKAMDLLGQAIKLAKEIKVNRLELDARMNLAWTEYRMGKREEAKKELKLVYENIPEEVFIQTKETKYPKVDEYEPYYYQQLSKGKGLEGLLWMKEFRLAEEAVEARLSEKYSDKAQDFNINYDIRDKKYAEILKDERVKNALRAAAEAYTLGLIYAQIYSPRSTSLTTTYDSLYPYLKKFNHLEIKEFYKFVKAARRNYRAGKMVLVDLGDLQRFMDECAGVSTEEEGER